MAEPFAHAVARAFTATSVQKNCSLPEVVPGQPSALDAQQVLPLAASSLYSRPAFVPTKTASRLTFVNVSALSLLPKFRLQSTRLPATLSCASTDQTVEPLFRSAL